MSFTLPKMGPEYEEDRISMIPIMTALLIIMLFYPAKSAPTTRPDGGDAAVPPVTFDTQYEYQYEWVPINDFGTMHITCYGPDRNGLGGFPLSGYVSRWFGKSRDDIEFTVYYF